MDRQDIKAMTPPELEASLTALGEPTFRAKQIFAWLHRGARSFEVMSNLSKALRDRLGALYFITAPALARKQVSAADGTVKYLWSLADGECVESVVMRYEHGNTVCVSSQVGCRMGCAFCASTLGGLRRNLTPSEILDQVIFSQLDSGARVSNVVLMGIGEPLDNFGNVLRFLELVTHPDGLNLGMRHISLSTCGLTENLDKLGAYNLQLTLSVSLHAPDDATRSRLMPVNRDGGVAALMDACRRYFAATGRRVTFEYAMIDGVNDTEEHARALVRVLRGGDEHRWHLNLIPLNPVPERALAPSRRESVEKFTRLLERGGVNFTIRRRLGADIDAACGQLRRSAVNRETRQQGE